MEEQEEEEEEYFVGEVFGKDSGIFQIPDKFYGPPRGGCEQEGRGEDFTSGYERSSEPMLTRTKDIYYPEYVRARARLYNPPTARVRVCVRMCAK